MHNSSPKKIIDSNKYIFCPSGTCLNMPEILYSHNPLRTNFQFKCTNINDKKEIIDLREFLERSAHIKCFSCQRKILDDKISYCKDCKMIIDESCIKYHQKLEHDIKLNEKMYNICFEHGNQYLFRCMNCNKSLCYKCDLMYHNDNNHRLEQLTKFSFNQNELNKIRESFEKQKKYFEKIKDAYNNLMQSLENDIQIKERLINNYMSFKLDYNSYLNLKKLTIKNNEKYEKILGEMLCGDNAENRSREINGFINNYL